MSFSVTADGVFDQFKSQIFTTRGPVNIQLHGIEATQFKIYDQSHTVTSDGADRPMSPIVTKLKLMRNGQEIETLTRQQLRDFFDFVCLHTDTNYRTVKNSQLWRTLYGVHPKTFSTYDSKQNTNGVAMFDSSYCQHCGLILPLRNLTIDHQKPQSGGEVEAMLRLFRAAGLTVSTGYGNKNRHLQNNFAAGFGGNTTVLPRGQKGNVNDRYTLTLKGALYFTVLQSFNLTTEMKKMSMHHIVNLRPMCGPCNSQLRDTNVIF